MRRCSSYRWLLFCFGHEREPLFNPFPHGRKPERFIAQVSEYAPDMGSLEFLVSGTFVGVGDFLSSFPEFFGRLFRSGRRFNGNLCGAGNSFPRSGREFAGKLSNPEPGCWKMSDDGHGLLTQFLHKTSTHFSVPLVNGRNLQTGKNDVILLIFNR